MSSVDVDDKMRSSIGKYHLVKYTYKCDWWLNKVYINLKVLWLFWFECEWLWLINDLWSYLSLISNTG